MIVVAVGASAGGLRPLQELFTHLPNELNMAYIVVQHLSPDFDSMMNDLLAKCTKIPIQIIADGMQISPNTIYLNPPRFDAKVVDDAFVLTQFDDEQLRLPINSMFNSVASRFGADSVGVILSGSGSDGASGIQHIQKMSGLTIVQSLNSAQFDGMPKNAMATNAVDYVLDPTEIASLLAEHSVQPVNRPTEFGSNDTSYLSGVQLIFSLLSESYGINFAHYKPTTVARRIDRRLQLNRHESVDAYSKVLRDDPSELDVLYHDLLIGVTKFFRDSDAFDLLRDELNQLIDELPENQPLRVWSVGCASGEEPYSLAIMLSELYDSRGLDRNFKVFATDVHDRILEHASRGIYDSALIEGLSPERKKKFFVEHGDNKLKVANRLRNHMVFATQNVVSDPPFTKMDLVVCRNLLIYLLDDAQASAISGFRYALNERGMMMLGPSETVGKMAPGFDVIDKGWRLFRKNGLLKSELNSGGIAQRSATQRDSSTLRLVQAETGTVRMPAIAQLMLSDLLTAAILLDSKKNILHVFGNASDYLLNDNGDIDGNLLDFIDGDAKTAIAALLFQATNQLGTEFVSQDLTVQLNDQHLKFDATAKSFSAAPGDAPVTLLQFKSHFSDAQLSSDQLSSDQLSSDQLSSSKLSNNQSSEIEASQLTKENQLTKETQSTKEAQSTKETQSTSNASARDDDGGPPPSLANDGLRSELQSTRARLNATIQQMCASNEELQAANEEMIASNEELQATNEELQSVNEELHTVNVEHQKKVLELEEMTDDFNNLFNSTDVGSILLDEELRIRKYTKAAKKYFRLMDHDIGRPLTNFASQVVIDDLPGIIHRVIESGDRFSTYAKDRQGQWLSLDIAPYSANNCIRGVIINLTDLTPAIRAVAKFKNGILVTENAGIWQWDIESQQMWWSPQLMHLLDLKPDEFQPSWEAFKQFVHPDDLAGIQPSHLTLEASDHQRSIRLKVSDGQYQRFELQWIISEGQRPDSQVITGSFVNVESSVAAAKGASEVKRDLEKKRLA